MEYQLSATTRTELGKAVHRLRKNKLLPAVLYGHKVSPISLSLPQQAFERVFRQARTNQLIDLQIDAQPAVKVLVHDIQRDPLSSTISHVDFFKIKMDERITAKVSLNFVGEASAVKQLGGTLLKNLTHLDVTCFPQELPPAVSVDISHLKNFTDTITVADLHLPEQLKVGAKPEELVAMVKPPRTDAELAALEEKPEENVAGVEVEKKVKEEEEPTAEGEAAPSATKETKETK